ncbi:MAG: YraN family protein [Candidatus Peribacteraceae bacterium]|jgi:putative endonuclease|nr:YraN family protein [Candidatus Peribacteraceae bacterium]|tara:strand:+ start:1201 stop:1611 length:411 start_codon:yes stop_codon:yes gene_type:complete
MNSPCKQIETIGNESPALAPHLKLGKIGEEIAVAYLKKNGYSVYKRNVRLGHDEIDIIAYETQEKLLVFVEVKTRKKKWNSYSPLVNLTRAKKKKMIRAKNKWISEHEYDEGCRIDVICVVGGEVVNHFKNIGVGE